MKVRVVLEDGRWGGGDHDFVESNPVRMEISVFLLGLLEQAISKPLFTSKSVLTEAQIRKSFPLMIGMPAREADVQILMMGGRAGMNTLHGMAEYIWDHLMGEPDSPSLEKVEQSLILTLNALE